MADFDLSLIAKFDTSAVEAGGAQVEKTIDKVAEAERRAGKATDEGARSSRDAAKAEKEHAQALNTARTAIGATAEAKRRKAAEDARGKSEARQAAAAEREHAKALDAVRAAIDPAYAAQAKLNKLVEQASALYKKGSISLAEYKAVQAQADAAMKGGAQNMGAMRAASANLGFQIQDITQGLAMGVNPMVIFGQQAGQTASAVAGLGGTAGRIGTFLAGPWGSLILAAVTVLGMLATTFLKSKDAGDKLSGALDFQKMSSDELRKAAAELAAQQEKSIQTSYAAEQQAIATAKADLKAAIATREKTRAMMENYKAGLTIQTGDVGATVAAQAGAAMMIGFTQRDLDNQDKAIADLERRYNASTVPAAARAATAAIDKQAASTLKLDIAETKLQAQRTAGLITYKQLVDGLAKIGAQRKAETDAIQDNERAQSKANRERERTIKLAEKEKQLSAFINPVAGGGRITGRFGDNRRTHAHGGLDIAAPTGTPVRAANVGVIESVGYAADYGKYVVVNHGAGTKTRYAHLSDNSLVRKGQQVEQGQTIGKVGSTGRSTGPHLHYEVTVNGKKVDPSKGKFLIDGLAVAQEAEKAGERLQDFADKAVADIGRISDQFGEQPRFITQAGRAVEKLDEIIKDLSERNVDGMFDGMIADAEKAKEVVADSLVRPFREMREESEKRIAVDLLLSQGRKLEADYLQRIWELESRLGPLTAARKEEVYGIVSAQAAVADEIEKSRIAQEAYLGATQSIRQEVENILAGQGKLSNFKTIFKQLNAKIQTEAIFGDVFRDMENYVKEKTGIESSVNHFTDETKRAGDSSGKFADAVNAAIERIRTGGPSVDSPGVQAESWQTEFDRVFGKKADGTDGDPIVVSGVKDGIAGMTPLDYFTEMGKKLVNPFLDGLTNIVGPEIAGAIQNVVGGAFGGAATGGTVGGILGGLKGLAGSIKGMPEGITKGLGGALKGAGMGTQAAGIMKSLGIKTSTTGAQIGGAIGGATQIPGLDIVGSIVGGLVGGMLKKNRTARAVITGIESVDVGGKDKKNYGAATGLAGSVTSGLSAIAKALNAELGAFYTTIGVRGKEFRVNTSGSSLKVAKGAKNFGDDEAAAIAYAIADAIADGAIKGISPAVERALKSSSDIDKALAEAVAVSDLETKIKYMGNEWAQALADFAKVAAERVRLAQTYGLDLLKVEKLNAMERKKIIEQAIEAQVGSLKSLLNDLKYGSLFEGTPQERRALLMTEIAKAEKDVKAGVDGATNRLADLERQLVDTSREAYGTAGTEYAADRAQAIATAERVIAEEQRRIAQQAAMAEQEIDLASESNTYLATMTTQLDQLITLAGGKPVSQIMAQNPYGIGVGDYRYPGVSY